MASKKLPAALRTDEEIRAITLHFFYDRNHNDHEASHGSLRALRVAARGDERAELRARGQC